ncbi:hypothetical protein CspHIS471_0302070 [Cutaneotrichosporon sp. HIS471]|nr:hypothetical protein CspHIS471_0302070 [Cutaneotrichosporon sp. HIS471]
MPPKANKTQFNPEHDAIILHGITASVLASWRAIYVPRMLKKLCWVYGAPGVVEMEVAAAAGGRRKDKEPEADGSRRKRKVEEKEEDE